jgi:5-methyltetrahydropteroyltriglutamate--homocysteine methyltransferase
LISEGGYEPVAEMLLGELDYDGYFLEYDTDRARGFEPLRFYRKGTKGLCWAW